MFAATSFAIAVSLSMDSFAAALGRGACQRGSGWPEALRVGLVFGLCQLAMPLIGWWIGSTFADMVQSVDHWIAFGLLLFVGGQMIREAFSDDCDDCERIARSSGWLPLFATGIATSIDACAVGIGLAMAEIDIVDTLTMIAVVTFLISAGGVLLGRAVGPWLGRRAEIVGGLGLIAIGIKILLDHTVFA
jgi:manganese efflux pump family protein